MHNDIKATLHQAWLVLRSVTTRRYTVLVHSQPFRSTQLPIPSGVTNEDLPKCSEAVQLGSKCTYGSFHSWIK